ncbi:MAG: thiamine pyrophosphate-binding protein, partial [Deltaproteobacteria bacterium]|nr:thiamine pyrophosphate-binding protein [Deltaproteobacteria bacterium]
MNGGELVAEVLWKQGVRHLFTLCGGHISPILVAAKRRGIRVVDVRDEVTAVFAADAMARLTGVPGVAAVTAGPGVTNTLTAVMNARMAESPVIVLGGATATVLKGRGSLQDIDQMTLVRPTVKRAETARSVRGLISKLESSFHVARSGVPGPVFVEAPVDLLYDEATVREWYAKDSGGQGTDLASRAINVYLKQHLFRQFAGSRFIAPGEPRDAEIPEASAKEITRVADRIRAAQRPVLVVGSGTMFDPSAVDALATAVRGLGMPVFLGGMARGLLGAEDPIQFRHQRTKALEAADLVIVAGFPLDFRMGYGRSIGRSAEVVTVNRDDLQVTKNRKPTIGITGDPGRFLRALSAAVGSNGRWGSWFDT